MTRKLLSLALSLMMCLSMAIPAMAIESEKVEIAVTSEAEILDFFKSSQFNPNKYYTFTYSNSKEMRIVCPSCGYNTYRGKITEEYDPNDPSGQGRSFACPGNPYLTNDVVTEMVVFNTQYCTTCGYERSTTSPKYYIECIEGPVSNWVATKRRTGGDMHQWLDWWDDKVPF